MKKVMYISFSSKRDIINPQIYVDNLTSTNTSKITSGYVYIEYIPKRG